MTNIYLNFGGREYHIDFDELDRFLFIVPENKEVSETETRIIFDTEDNPTGKEITIKSSVNEKEINGVRYEIITGMVQTIIENQSNDDGDDLLGAEVALDKMSFAYKLAFNTLVKYKIIKEIK